MLPVEEADRPSETEAAAGQALGNPIPRVRRFGRFKQCEKQQTGGGDPFTSKRSSSATLAGSLGIRAGTNISGRVSASSSNCPDDQASAERAQATERANDRGKRPISTLGDQNRAGQRRRSAKTMLAGKTLAGRAGMVGPEVVDVLYGVRKCAIVSFGNHPF